MPRHKNIIWCIVRETLEEVNRLNNQYMSIEKIVHARHILIEANCLCSQCRSFRIKKHLENNRHKGLPFNCTIPDSDLQFKGAEYLVRILMWQQVTYHLTPFMKKCLDIAKAKVEKRALKKASEPYPHGPKYPSLVDPDIPQW